MIYLFIYIPTCIETDIDLFRSIYFIHYTHLSNNFTCLQLLTLSSIYLGLTCGTYGIDHHRPSSVCKSRPSRSAADFLGQTFPLLNNFFSTLVHFLLCLPLLIQKSTFRHQEPTISSKKLFVRRFE